MPDPVLSANPTGPAAPWRRRIAATVILLSLGPVALAQRDLRRRPRGEVHGPKMLWRVGSTNALVAVAYLRWGRKGTR